MNAVEISLKYSSRLATAGAVLAFFVFFLLALRAPSHLYIEMANDNDGAGQVYVDSGSGYEPEKFIPFSLMPDGKVHSYGIDIRSSIPKSIRIDPGASTGNIKIENVRLESALFIQHYSCDQLRLLHALDLVHTESGKCEFIAIADDPYFDFKIFSSLSFNNTHLKWQVIVAGFAYAAIIFLLIILAIKLRGHDTENNENLLTNSRCKSLYIFLAFGFISFVFLNLHVSSVDEWRNYVSTDIRSGVLLGHTRPIRSDEWMVSTPFYSSQVANDFAVDNPSLGASNVALVATVPVKGIYGYTQPRFWGFYLMGFDRGFSWLYAWRVFVLFLTVFSLFSILTKGDFWLSMIGSAWIALSPFMQWWFGSNLPDMVIGFAGGVTSLYMLVRATSLRTIIPFAIALFFAGTSFVSALYPAFLLPLFYLALFLIGGLLFRDRLDRSFINHWQSKAGFFMLALGGILSILALWHSQSSAVIDLVQNSAYPGKRVVLGGDMPFSSLFTGWFSPFLRIDRFPLVFGNVCESSNFLLFFPFAWMVMLYRYLTTRQLDPLALAISFYILLMLAWMFVGYPEWIAQVTKMNMSPPTRSLLGLGLASIFLTVYVFSTHISAPPIWISKTANISRFVMLCIALSGIFYIVLMLRNHYPDYVTWGKIVFLTPILTLWFVFYLMGSKKWVTAITILLFIPGLLVNPLAHGVHALENAALTSVLKEDKLYGETKWLVTNTIFYPQYFKANGATVWNGVRFISDLAEMRILDPSNRYRDVWNRYAHFVVLPLPAGLPAVFELQQADVVRLNIDFCSDEVRTLGINRFAFFEKPEPDKISCLELIRQGPVAGAWLYKHRTSQRAKQ